LKKIIDYDNCFIFEITLAELKYGAELSERVDENLRSVKDGELAENATYKKFLLVRTEGTRQVERNIDHCNLNYDRQTEVLARFIRKRP
jgi:hypothetical protein